MESRYAPADRCDDLFALGPSWGKQVVDGGTFTFVMRAHKAQRFVHDDKDPMWMLEGLPIDKHILRANLQKNARQYKEFLA